LTGHEFYRKILSHDDIEWLGVIEGPSPAEDEVLVKHTKTGVKHAVSTRSIIEATWGELEAVFTFKREPRIMIQLTRIVGYYSRIRNWNSGKRRELEDRHKGNYGLPEKKVDIKAELPQEVVESLVKSGAEMSCELAVA